MKRRHPIVPLVATCFVLAACGSAAPPAKELANEMIDTLDVSAPVKDCMHEAVADFQLTPEQAQGFTDFDDVAQKAAEGNELALRIMDEFEASLAACN